MKSLILSFSLFITASCTTNSSIQTISENSTSNNLTAQELDEKKREYSENGYSIGNYRMVLTEGQKKNEEELEAVASLKFYEEEFLIRQDLIDTSKKINLIPFRVGYSKDDETYGMLVYLMNTSKEIITNFKTEAIMKVNYMEDILISFDLRGDDFIEMQPNDVIIIVVEGTIGVEYSDRLLSLSSDVSIETEQLEVNGKLVDNLN